ncbi:MAG TPA: hypothetical protein VG929_00450 [Actinomycetota bacterium]|nr:hypothetical protein [Actinomycetota bacterium]
MDSRGTSDEATSAVELVQRFLRGQNLEQLGRMEEAVQLYEQAVAARFDSPGPYDRLIYVYSDRAQHAEVVRIIERALEHVHTHHDKRRWYEDMRSSASAAMKKVPKAAPKRPG